MKARLTLRLIHALARVAQAGSVVGLDMGAVSFPRPRFDAAERRAHEVMRQLVVAGGGGVIDYTSSYPKHRFLDYLISRGDVVVHGSNIEGIATFEPRESNDAGTRFTAVYAADDGVHAMFYATINRNVVPGLFNSCYWGRPGLRRWFYLAVTGDPDSEQSWCDGFVYILPRASFRQGHGREVYSPTAVRPLAALAVTPEDFPLQAVVATFEIDRPFMDTLRSIQARRDHAGTG